MAASYTVFRVNLYLVTHGSAVPGEKDPERPLSEAGITESSRVSRLLLNCGVRVQVLAHSEKTCCRQSAQILLPAIFPGGRLTFWEGLGPDDSPRSAIKAIKREKADLLLVAETPHG
ncbi:hypothetical protein [Verrucomicrobium sp. 3C]|uniref:hypothetical protein n=1 Tax=Verrucomicrobium sp. 3C TaxID=1134055 RepID=UPI0012DBD5FB|nr:hypothetical protein [Verrucomicrobium sp. 3C]